MSIKKRIYTYYLGVMECQFELTNESKLGTSQDLQHQIKLQPRFKLYRAKKISRDEFIASCDYSTPYVIHNEVENIECYPSLTNKAGKSLLADQIYVAFQPADANQTSETIWSELLRDNIDLLNIPSALPKNQFLAAKDKGRFGRFHGMCYCRMFEEEIIESKNFKPKESPNIAYFSDCEHIDRFGRVCKRQALPGNKYCQLHSNYLGASNGGGCFRTPYSRTSDGNYTTDTSNLTKGCFNGFMPGAGGNGCFGGFQNGLGCFGQRIGCGILSGLIGLLLLLGLLWSLFNGAFNIINDTDKATKVPDTVYVEVLKEVKDTLKIVKTDTVSYVDSTTTNTYEMVSLPNVQFYTNSDLLLPSSVKELQQLAEYLIKNDQSLATIMGHTDNTGDSKLNKELSQKRAESVKRFLENLGIDSKRLVANGLGDTKPKGDNATEEGRLMNRRVEVQITNTQKVTQKRTEMPKK